MFKIITAHNNKFKNIANYNIPIIKNYCEYYGYSYQVYEIPDDYHRPAAWSKIEYLIQEINNRPNQYTFWIDADAIILRHDIDLWSFIEPGKYLYLSKDNNGINTGVILLKNHPRIKKFLEKTWSMTQYMHHIWWEQAAVIDLIDNDYLNINECMKYIPQTIFNAYTSCINETSFVAHFPGPFLEKKLHDIDHYKNRYQYQEKKPVSFVDTTEILDLFESWQKLNRLCYQTNSPELMMLSEKMFQSFCSK